MAPVAVFGLPGKPEEKIRQMMERAASAREFTVETKMKATFQQEQTERTEMEKAVSVSSACSRSTRDLSEFIRVYRSYLLFSALSREFTTEEEMNTDFQQEQTERTERKKSLFPPLPPVNAFRLLAREFTNETKT
jgi:hypothetical protein